MVVNCQVGQSFLPYSTSLYSDIDCKVWTVTISDHNCIMNCHQILVAHFSVIMIRLVNVCHNIVIVRKWCIMCCYHVHWSVFISELLGNEILPCLKYSNFYRYMVTYSFLYLLLKSMFLHETSFSSNQSYYSTALHCNIGIHRNETYNNFMALAHQVCTSIILQLKSKGFLSTVECVLTCT